MSDELCEYIWNFEITDKVGFKGNGQILKLDSFVKKVDRLLKTNCNISIDVTVALTYD